MSILPTGSVEVFAMADDALHKPTKAPELEVNSVADGYIVYQPDRNRVHYLNQTAALVFELCNGNNTVAEMPKILQSLYDLVASPAEEVAECLASLRNEGLIC